MQFLSPQALEHVILSLFGLKERGRGGAGGGVLGSGKRKKGEKEKGVVLLHCANQIMSKRVSDVCFSCFSFQFCIPTRVNRLPLGHF